MAVQCAKCGEELMGAVNRCWRCGQEFVPRNSDTGLPPIRRLPLAAATRDVWDAELSDPRPTTLDLPVVNGPVRENQPARRVLRRGSPFGDRGAATLETMETKSALGKEDEAKEREAKYQKNGGAAASAVLTVPLGLISFAAAFLFPLAGFLLSILGLGMGIWGLKSRRRGLVIAGLLLCCLSLAIASFNGVVQIYVSQYGRAPWEAERFLP